MPEFVLRELLRSDWFERLVDGVRTEPDTRTLQAIDMVVGAHGEAETRVLGRPATTVASCLLHVLGARVEGQPFPTRLDAVSALRLIAAIPPTKDGRRRLAHQIVEACERNWKAIQLPIRW